MLLLMPFSAAPAALTHLPGAALVPTRRRQTQMAAHGDPQEGCKGLIHLLHSLCIPYHQLTSNCLGH